MFPFYEVFGIEIASYGTLIVIGTAAGVGVAILRSKIYALQKNDVLYAFIYALIGVIIGAKLLYIITALPGIVQNFEYFKLNKEFILSLLTGGFVFYGGLIGGVIGVMLYCRQFRTRFWPMIDTLIPSVPLIHAFGRIGCFCAGCCYGKEFPPPLGMYFNYSPYAPHDVTLFPIQLLEALLCLCIFGIVIIFARKQRRKGAVVGAYLLCYSVLRFILEFFRMDEARGFIFGLSTSQWISILLLLASIVLLITPIVSKSGSQKIIRE